jgi:hypothetical protein
VATAEGDEGMREGKFFGDLVLVCAVIVAQLTVAVVSPSPNGTVYSEAGREETSTAYLDGSFCLGKLYTHRLELIRSVSNAKLAMVVQAPRKKLAIYREGHTVLTATAKRNEVSWCYTWNLELLRCGVTFFRLWFGVGQGAGAIVTPTPQAIFCSENRKTRHRGVGSGQVHSHT